MRKETQEKSQLLAYDVNQRLLAISDGKNSFKKRSLLKFLPPEYSFSRFRLCNSQGQISKNSERAEAFPKEFFGATASIILRPDQQEINLAKSDSKLSTRWKSVNF